MSAMEQAVVGACLNDESAYWKVADVLSVADFSDPRNASIFAAIAETAAGGHHLDAVSAGDQLPDLAGYAVELAANCTNANARFYAERVASESITRQVRTAGQRISRLDTGGALSEAARMIAAIAPHRGSEALPIKAYIKQAVQRMQERCDEPGKIRGITTGVGSIDGRLGGLEDGTLNILAARPSMGKTALAMQVAAHAARQGHVLVISLETTGEKLSERLLSHLSGVSFGQLRTPHTMPEELWPSIMRATQELEKLPLTIDESGAHTSQSICARAQQANMQNRLRLVVIDHVGLVQLPGRANRADEIGEVTRQFKMLSKSLGCPVLALVQLNRKVEETSDKRPLMSHLRDSGRIEEDADTVGMLYRRSYYFDEEECQGSAELIWRKVRDGETGTDYLHADLERMTFHDLDGKPDYLGKENGRNRSGTSRGYSGPSDRKSAAAGA